MRNILLRTTYMVMVFSLVGCTTTKKDWNEAQKRNSKEAYQTFLNKHPKSEFTNDAEKKVEDLDWLEAKRRNTKSSYNQFIGSHPTSVYIQEAYDNIIQLDFTAVKKTNSVKAYQEFLRLHPNAKQTEEVLRRLEDAKRKQGKKLEEEKVESTKIAAYQNAIIAISSKYSKKFQNKMTPFEIDKLISEYSKEKSKILEKNMEEYKNRHIQKDPDYISGLDSLEYEKKLMDIQTPFENSVVDSIPHIESDLIERISAKGAGARLVIRKVIPQEGPIERLTILGLGADGNYNKANVAMFMFGVIQVSMEFPGDNSAVVGGVPTLRFSPKSVHRFAGTVKLKDIGYTFYGYGQKINRLTFGVIKNIGYVYMRGTGSVVIFELGDAKPFLGELKRGHIGERLRQEFKRNEINLSGKLRVVNEKNLWKIIDLNDGRIFYAIKVDEGLSISAYFE